MKLKALIIVAVAALTAFSCKKEYTCDCETKWTDSNGTMVNKNSSEKYSAKLTEKQAKAACEHEEQSLKNTFDNINTFNGSQTPQGSISVSCDLN